MDCQAATERMAGWVDGQLSPGEHELMDAHLRRCDRCSALAQAMARQPLRPPQHARLPAGFWDRMSDTLAAELDSDHTPAPPPAETAAPLPPLWRRPVRLSPLAAAAYAILLVGVLGWGLHTRGALQDSRAETAELQQRLEREQRLAGQPLLTTPKGYRAPTSRASRGTL